MIENLIIAFLILVLILAAAVIGFVYTLLVCIALHLAEKFQRRSNIDRVFLTPNDLARVDAKPRVEIPHLSELNPNLFK